MAFVAATSNAEEKAHMELAIQLSLDEEEAQTKDYKKFRESLSADDIAELFNRLYETRAAFLKRVSGTYRFVPAAGDGNCLFNSIALQYYGDADPEDRPAQLRAGAMDWISNHADDFSAFIRGETGETVPQYVARMSKNGIYGGDIEIRALSQQLRLPFVVYSYSTHTNTMTSVLFDNDGALRGIPPVTLLHGGIVLHYDALFLNIDNIYPIGNYRPVDATTAAAWAASLKIANEVRRIHDAAEENIRTAAAIAAVAAAGGGGGGGPVTTTTVIPPKEPVDDIATSLAASLLFQTAALAAHVGLTPRPPPVSGSGSGSGSATIITSDVPSGAPLTMPFVPPAAADADTDSGPDSLFTGDEVYMCVTYANKLFFYVNTPGGKMTVPHGPILKADSGPAAAALRILDTYITGHGLLDTNLVEFYRETKQKKKIYYFYGVVPMPPPPPPPKAAAATAATATGAIVPVTTGALVPVLPGPPPPPPPPPAAKPVQLFTNATPIPADVDGTFTGLSGFPIGSAGGAGAGAGPGATKPKGPAAVRVVSYNILSNNLAPAHINSAKWLAGRNALLKAKLDAEIKKDSIICLQEVSDADDAFLKANVFAGPAYTYQRAPWTNPKLAPPGVNIFGVVIAFPNKKYNILSTKKSSTVKPSSGIENILLNIALTETATANNFCVSTYHMPISWTKGSTTTIDHAAMAQHAMAAATAANKYAGIMPYIFCGDCNIQSFIQDKPTDPKTPNPAYEALFGHPLKLRSVYKDKNKKEPALTTFSHRMTMDKSGRPVIDTATRMPQLEPLFQGTLDYIFISPGWTVTKVDTLPTVTAPIPDAKEPSDHLMIGSDLQLVPGIAGTGAGVPSPGPSAGPTTTNTTPPYSDGDIQALRLWLVDKIATPYKTRAMMNMLKRLAQKMGLPLPPGVSERDFIDLPTWAIGLFDVKDIKENCFGRQIITRDCSPLRILQDILDADEYANEYRILDGDSDAQRIYYDALVAQIAAETDLTKKAVLQKKFYKAFRDRVLHIKQDAPGPATTWAPPPPLAQYKRKIPNKYRARAYRNKVTTWGDHTVAGSDAEAEYNKLSFDEKPMYQQNVGILEPLVQPEIWKNDATKDKLMTIAVLESLWDCGLNPTMDGKSSCFPAQVIAELREYGNKRIQGSQQAHAKRILTNNDWPFLQGMLVKINSVIGATPFPKLPRRAAVAPVAGGPGGGGGGGGPRPPFTGPGGPPRPPFTGPGGPSPFTGPGAPPRPPFTGPGSTFRLPFTGGTPRPPITGGPGPSIFRGPTGAATLSSGPGGRGGPAPRAPPPSSHIIPNLMLGGHAAILPNRMLGAGLTRLPPIRRRG